MRAPASRGRSLLALALFLVGAGLVSWDAWRWWRSRHPVDDGGYAVRADWSAANGGITHFFGYVYRDRNRNGRQDSGEPPFAGVAVDVTGPAGDRRLLRSNLDGFVNVEMSRASRSATVHGPGEVRFAVRVPPGFVVTSRNGEQVGRVELLAGAPGDLVAARPIAPVGLAPELVVAGHLGERAVDGALRAAAAARLLVTGPGAVPREVPVATDGAFRFPVEPGVWRLVASAAGSGARLEREVEVRDAPVVLAGLVLGENSPMPAGPPVTIDFERVTGGLVSRMGFGFGIEELDWGALHALRARDGEGDGYVNVLASGSYVAYSSIPVTLARAGGFDFLGGYVGVAHRAAEGETLRLQAFRGERLVADDTLTLSAFGPVWLDARLLAVDRVVLSARHSWQFAVDDLQLAAPPAPSPPDPPVRAGSP